MKTEKTNRGFDIASFEDRYGLNCSLQKSSLATEDCIWLGISDEKPPQVLRFKLNGGIADGWQDCPPPKGLEWKDILIHNRMHLTQEQVKQLLPHLIKFSETGNL